MNSKLNFFSLENRWVLEPSTDRRRRRGIHAAIVHAILRLDARRGAGVAEQGSERSQKPENPRIVYLVSASFPRIVPLAGPLGLEYTALKMHY